MILIDMKAKIYVCVCVCVLRAFTGCFHWRLVCWCEGCTYFDDSEGNLLHGVVMDTASISELVEAIVYFFFLSKENRCARET